jgi:O-antigen/teichoic acid export membrane protein
VTDRTGRVLRNVFSNWASFAVNIVIALLMAPFVIRSLGDTYYGLWIILSQFTGYLGILDLGMRSSVVKYVAGHHARREYDDLNAVVRGAVSMYSGAALLALVASALVAGLLPRLVELHSASLDVARVVILLGGVTMAVGLQFNAVYGVLMGVQRYDVFNRIGIISTLLRTLAVVAALKSGFGVIGLSVIQLLTVAGTSAAAYTACRRFVPTLRLTGPRLESGVYRRILDYSLASFFVAISQKVIFQTDALVIGIYMSASAVTYYSLPASLIEYIRRFAAAMTETFVPLTSQLKARAETEAIRELLLRGTRIATLIGTPMCIVCLAVGERFIGLWVGPEYAARGSSALTVLAIAQLFSIPHLTSREVMNGLGLHRINAYCYVAEAVANLALSLLLVRRLGLLGVAVGTAIPHLVLVTLVFPFLICRVLRLPLWHFFRMGVIPPLLCAVPFGLALKTADWLWPAGSMWQLALMGSLTAPLFLISAWLVGLRAEDREVVKAALSKAVRARTARADAPPLV